MPKVQIDIPQPAYDNLKRKAKEKYQSLRAYLTYTLITYDKIDKYIDELALLSQNGATIKTKVTPPPKPLTDEEKLEMLQKKAKKIVGHELEDEEDYMLTDLQRDNIYYDERYERLYREGGRMKVVYIYDLPEERQEEYLKDFKDWERHENRGLNTLGIILFTFTLPIIILSGNT